MDVAGHPYHRQTVGTGQHRGVHERRRRGGRRAAGLGAQVARTHPGIAEVDGAGPDLGAARGLPQRGRLRGGERHPHERRVHAARAGAGPAVGHPRVGRGESQAGAGRLRDPEGAQIERAEPDQVGARAAGPGSARRLGGGGRRRQRCRQRRGEGEDGEGADETDRRRHGGPPGGCGRPTPCQRHPGGAVTPRGCFARKAGYWYGIE